METALSAWNYKLRWRVERRAPRPRFGLFDNAIHAYYLTCEAISIVAPYWRSVKRINQKKPRKFLTVADKSKAKERRLCRAICRNVS